MWRCGAILAEKRRGGAMILKVSHIAVVRTENKWRAPSTGKIVNYILQIKNAFLTRLKNKK